MLSRSRSDCKGCVQQLAAPPSSLLAAKPHSDSLHCRPLLGLHHVLLWSAWCNIGCCQLIEVQKVQSSCSCCCCNHLWLLHMHTTWANPGQQRHKHGRIQPTNRLCPDYQAATHQLHCFNSCCTSFNLLLPTDPAAQPSTPKLPQASTQ